MLVSVHVPKTGGVSFRTLLKAHFKDKLKYDYNDKPLNKNTLTRNLAALTKMFNAIKISKEYDCVHGHFLPIKYCLVKEKSFAIWLRDPVERVASRYYYYKRIITSISNPASIKFINNSDLSLKEFCEIKHFQNLYAKYLWGLTLDKFCFVGITENFENSIEVFRRMFQIDSSTCLTIMNVNPHKKSSKYQLSREIRNLIYDTNYKDYEIYKRGLILNHELEKKYLN